MSREQGISQKANFETKLTLKQQDLITAFFQQDPKNNDELDDLTSRHNYMIIL